MKLTMILLTAVFLNVYAGGLSQNINFSGDKVSLKTVFSAVKQQTGFVFLIGGPVHQSAKLVSISAKDMPLDDFLEAVFEMQPLEYAIAGKNIMVTVKPRNLGAEDIMLPAYSIDSVPAIKITGTVMDFNGQVLSGATIRVKGKKGATTSNTQGAFEISAEVGSTLLISYAGFVTAEEKVSSSQHVVVKLEANSMLEEAVIYNGYQKIQQKYLTGSVTSLRMDSIMQPGLNTIDKMLEGRVPGMMFMQNSGQSGATPKLRIRGTNTYLGSREPLWVVDGVIRTNPFPIDPSLINDPDFVNLLGNAISGLNPFDIDQVDVLKDATAAALYGVRAANGVIVITTKRGKPGPPTIGYSITNTFTKRPRYTDKAMYMMNSQERVDVSREMIQKQMAFRGAGMEAYEVALQQYYDGEINYDAFKQAVSIAETMNTDWLGAVMQDVFSTNHTLSISGGSNFVAYRASLGYRSEPGVIKKEKNELYTGMLNMQVKYSKMMLDFNVQFSSNNKNYTPAEIGVLNYAQGTSRSIPLYNEDGSLYFYSTIDSDPSSTLFRPLNRMNILNEMNNTEEKMKSNEYNASLQFTYEIVKNLQFNARFAYTVGASNRELAFTENSNWANNLRLNSYLPNSNSYSLSSDPMPYGGEYRSTVVNKNSYQLNARLNYSSFFDTKKLHQLTADLALDVNSYRNNSISLKERGYYPERGKTFAVVNLSQYSAYSRWVAANSIPLVLEDVNNSLRPFLTTTYIFNNKYVLSGTLSQEFSNSFGSRSNEQFLPTWALSARWNMQEDLLKNSSWINDMSLLVSLGRRGNMLAGQTVNTIMKKGPMNTYFQDYTSHLAYFPNPNLKWEIVEDYNANLIFSLFGSKVRGSIAYFFSRTNNAFLNMKVSAVNGAMNNTYVVNGGILENKGLELSLNFKVIDNAGENGRNGFMWRLDPQLGQVFNKLLGNSINTRNVLVDEATLNYTDYLNGMVPMNGKSVNTFYSYRFKELDGVTGYPVFYNAEPENRVELRNSYNAVSKNNIYNTVMVESGRREPVLQGGLNNAFSYGDWVLNVNFTYSFGNNIRLLKIASGNYGTFRPTSQQNLRKEFTERWRYPGDEQFTNVPAIQGDGRIDPLYYAWWNISATRLTTPFAENYYQMYDNSDIRVVSGDNVKLQYVSLAYRLPKEVISKLRFNGVLVSLSGNNLFVIADEKLRGQDPSQSGSAANINLTIRPVYTFNINVSF